MPRWLQILQPLLSLIHQWKCEYNHHIEREVHWILIGKQWERSPTCFQVGARITEIQEVSAPMDGCKESTRVYWNTIEVDFWVNYELIQSDTKCGDGIWSSLKQATEASTKYTSYWKQGCMDLLEVYRLYCSLCTVVDVVVQGAVHPLPHVGLQPVTFWMLQDKPAPSGRVYPPWTPPRITEPGSATGDCDHVFSN